MAVTITNLCVGRMSKFNENFHYNLRVLLLRLSFLIMMITLLVFPLNLLLPTDLVDDDVLHVPVLAALLLDLLLKLLVHLVTTHHILEAQHPALPHAAPRS